MHDILILYMAGNDPQNYWQNSDENQDNEAFTPTDNSEMSPNSSYVNPTEATPLSPKDTPDNPPVSWTAKEYVHEERTPIWFILFVLIVVALIAVDIFVLKSWTFSALVVVMAVALVIYIRRPPRLLTYALSPNQGLYVGERLYSFDEFRSFSLIQDGPHYSILLVPRKRFATGVSVFFPDEAGERIVDILGQHLPMENLKLDIVDVIVRKLRL